MKWEELPFRERAEYIRVGVKNGLKSLEDVRSAYHKFQNGGHTDFKTEEEARAYAAQYPNAGIFVGSNREGERYNRTYPLDEVVVTAKDLSKPYESFLDKGDVFNFREMAYNSSPIKRMEYMRDLASYSDNRNDFFNYYNLIRNKYQPLDSVITNEEFKYGYVKTSSSKEMEDFYRGRIKEANYIPILERFGNAAQNAFLLSPLEQDTLMTNQGYTRDTKAERNRDYGLVQKAVGKRNLPIYQKYNDAINRDSLKVIGNVTAKSYKNAIRNNREGNWFGNKGTLVHAGRFPTALYVNPTSGELYQKGWDLNDYVGTSGLLDSYSEIVGNPLVVTTGIQKLDWANLDLPDIWDKETVDSLKSIYPNIQLDSEYFKSRKHNKKSLGGHIYDGTTEKTQQMYTRGNNNPIAFDGEGNLIDQVTGEKGVMLLPEFVVKGKDYTKPYESTTNWGREYVNSFGDVLSMTPVAGDLMDGLQSFGNAIQGNYTEAGLGALGLLLPNFIEKPSKLLFKGLKKYNSRLLEGLISMNAGQPQGMDAVLKLLGTNKIYPKLKDINIFNSNNKDLLKYVLKGDKDALFRIGQKGTNPFGYTFGVKNKPINSNVVVNSPYHVGLNREDYKIGDRVFNGGSNVGPQIQEFRGTQDHLEYLKRNYKDAPIESVNLFPGKDAADLSKLESFGSISAGNSDMFTPLVKGVNSNTRYNKINTAGHRIGLYKDSKNKLYGMEEDILKYNVDDYISKWKLFDKKQLALKWLDKNYTPIHVTSNVKPLNEILDDKNISIEAKNNIYNFLTDYLNGSGYELKNGGNLYGPGGNLSFLKCFTDYESI